MYLVVIVLIIIHIMTTFKYKKNKKLKTKLQKTLVKKIGKAIIEYKMINNNDRILVGISGGKDSLTLIHILKLFKKKHLFILI